MKIHFDKYHGTGNDFVIIDNRKLFFPDKDVELINILCDRRFGIGADGLILIQNHESFDFEMKYFNSDGMLASMCGNGGRCAVHFARKLKIISEHCSFFAADGFHQAYIKNNSVSLSMNTVKGVKRISDHFLINSGSPHLIIFLENAEKINITEEGRKYRNDKEISKDGVNVNFVQILDNKSIWLRTYERGVESETYSCGTGAIASTIATCIKNEKNPASYLYSVQVTGGILQVAFDRISDELFDKVILTGSVAFVYSGEIEPEIWES